MKIPKPTFRDLLWMTSLIAILILWKQCGKKSVPSSFEVEKVKKAAIDSSAKVLASLKDSLDHKISKAEDRADSILGESTVFEYERNQAWGEIDRLKKVQGSLAGKVIEEKGQNDTDCIELAHKAQELNSQLEYQEGVTGKLLNDLHLLSTTKDSIIADERRIKNGALEQGLKTAKAYSELFASFKKTQPRNAILIGPEASWSPWTQTVGAAIALQNKKGTQYQFGAGLDAHNVGYYLKFGLLYKISFRKN